MPVLKFEQSGAVQAMQDDVAVTDLDLSNALIAQSAIYMGCESILTFDRKAARNPAFAWVQAP